MAEVFETCIEFTNPGSPLVPIGLVRTCYMFVRLACMDSTAIGNNDVRRAFGLPVEHRPLAGRIIRDSIKAEQVKPVDPGAVPKVMRCVPFWS